MILAQLPKEIQHLHPEGTIMTIIKPLYGIAETGTHWWATYSKHHREKLLMTTSTYDPYFLILINHGQIRRRRNINRRHYYSSRRSVRSLRRRRVNKSQTSRQAKREVDI